MLVIFFTFIDLICVFFSLSNIFLKPFNSFSANIKKGLWVCEVLYLAWIRQPFPATAASDGRSIVVKSTSGTLQKKAVVIDIFKEQKPFI